MGGACGEKWEALYLTVPSVAIFLKYKESYIVDYLNRCISEWITQDRLRVHAPGDLCRMWDVSEEANRYVRHESIGFS